MDAEKRHQLKTNELAEALGKVRDFGGDPQTRYWMIGIAAILVAYAGYRLWNNMAAQRVAAGWHELSQVSAQDNASVAIDELRTLITQAPNQTAEAVGRIRLAAALRNRADETPAERESLLKEAVETLKPLVSDPNAEASLVAAAAFSLATMNESLREFDAAAVVYKMIVDEKRFEGSPFREASSKRLETLDELRVPIAFEPGMPPEPVAPPIDLSRPPGQASVQPVTAAPPPAAATPKPEPATEKPAEESTDEPASTDEPPTEEPAPDPAGADTP